MKRITPYKTEYDLEGREFIASKINQIMESLPETETIQLLVIGSPDCKELSSVAKEYKKRINLITVDPARPRTTIIGELKASYKSYKHPEGSFFEISNKEHHVHRVLNNRYGEIDVVLHRWFLHHLTDVEKLKCLGIVNDLMTKDGILYMIDWFIPDYEANNHESHWQSAKKYYDYQDKYGLAPIVNVQKFNRRFIQDPDGKGGKFTSIEKIELMLREKNFKFERHLMCEDKVDNPELFGQNLYVCKKRRK